MPRFKTVSLIATLVLLLAVVGLVASRTVLATHPVGIAVQGAAVLLMLWARVTFGIRSFHAAADATTGGLVTAGPYWYIRHPIYAAVLLFCWTGVAAHAGPQSLALATLATAATAVRIWAEEHLVVARYPEYTAYAARTRRLIPWIF